MDDGEELSELRDNLREARRVIDELRAENARCEARLRDAERSCAESEARAARLCAMLDQSADVISLSDADGNILEVFGAIERILGRPAAEIVGTNGYEWFHPEDREHVGAMLSAVGGEGGHSALAEARVLRPDGSTRWLELRAASRLEDPAVGAVIGNVRDVTERREATEALSARDEQYRHVFDATPVPIVVHVEGRVAFANPAAADGLGFRDVSELVGRSMLELAHGESRAQMEARMTNASQPVAGMLPRVEQELRRADGRIITAEVTTTRFLFEGRPAAISVAHDVTARKQAEDALRAASLEADRARRWLEATLDALPIAAWITDADAHRVHANAAVAALWGQAPDVTEANAFEQYRGWFAGGGAVQPDQWPLARTLRTGETIAGELIEIERADGARRHVLGSSAPIRGADGRLEGAVGVLVDITDRVRAEQERERLIASLDFARQRLGTLLERAPAFIAVTRGPAHTFELANAATRELMGARELVGRDIGDVLPEAAAQGFSAIADEVLRTGEPFVGTGMPLTLPHDVGARTVYMNFVYQPVVGPDGARSGVFMLGVDVTEQVVEARRVRAQFEALPLPTLVFRHVRDDDGRAQLVFVDHNRAAAVMAPGGIGPLGMRLSDYLPDDAPTVREILGAIEEGEVRQRELEYRFRSMGELRRFVATIAPIPPDLVVLFADDVTERRELEEQLRQSQKMEAIGRVAGGVAHDFNNLLSVILSYTEFALEASELDAQTREDILEIKRAGERAGELTRQMLMFSRQQVIAPQPLRLADCVKSVERMLRRVIGEDIELVLITTDTGTVHADPAQIDLVLMNLAVNARDAMPRGGSITIATADVELDASRAQRLGVSPGPHVQLSFRDDGIGMDAETQARVFEPFFTTKDPGKGTGLGLATVFGIVRQSLGGIVVESEPGEGATFLIHFPRHAASETLAPRSSVRPPAGGAETILLVDDDSGVRRAARTILGRAGYRVLEAQTVGDAILLGEQHPDSIHLLLTDVVMPLMSGPELAARLLALRPAMRVLLVSGYAGDELAHHGAVDAAFLQKPFTPESLIHAVRDALDVSHQLD